jgi:hypothetical protein
LDYNYCIRIVRENGFIIQMENLTKEKQRNPGCKFFSLGCCTQYRLKLNKSKKEIKIEPVKIIEYYCKAHKDLVLLLSTSKVSIRKSVHPYLIKHFILRSSFADKVSILR